MPGWIRQLMEWGVLWVQLNSAPWHSHSPRVDKGRSAGQNEKASQYEIPASPELFLSLVPEWRNWQTRYVQVVVIARSWRFESSLGHQLFNHLGR